MSGADPWLGWNRPQVAGRGLPIGNLTSQWWGNVYLDGLDHYVQRTLRDFRREEIGATGIVEGPINTIIE